jgi:hypothetical protein
MSLASLERKHAIVLFDSTRHKTGCVDGVGCPGMMSIVSGLGKSIPRDHVDPGRFR